MTSERFYELVCGTFLASFCRARPGYEPRGLQAKSIQKVDHIDAEWFVTAIEEGFVSEEGGFFTVPLSRAREQIFWSGEKCRDPRPIYLWLEPVITIGAIARLAKGFGWPVNQLGMQSCDWAFDVVCYEQDGEKEAVLGEVKKTEREVDRLVDLMMAFSRILPLIAEPTNSVEKNAYRKVQGIRRCWPKLVWILGPGEYEKVFSVVRDTRGENFRLESVDIAELNFGSSNKP